MHLGFIGLGKMGGNMALRLVTEAPGGVAQGGHEVIGYAHDSNPDIAGVPGIRVVGSIAEIVAGMTPPRVVWVMVPAGDATASVIRELGEQLSPGDMVIDGGNNYFKDSQSRRDELAKRQIEFLDIGVSGGIWGRTAGYCLMIGGSEQAVSRCRPLFETLAPGSGWAHVGPSGAGHFVKMIHNGIEYGMMQAYAEGFELLHHSQFPLDLSQIAKVWNHGSVVRSWLLELAERALALEADLRSIQPYVEDSGEGRWTVLTAIEEAVGVPVIAAALFARFESRDPVNFSARLNAALRQQFGGHAVATKK